jgi:hypothetical protein
MANGPLGGNMGTPPVPPQPPQVSFETTAQSRGNFNNFLKSIPPTTALTPLPPMGSTPMMPTPMPPMGGNPMANIDIFNQPMGMMGMNQPPMNPMMQPPMQTPMMMAGGGNVPPRRTDIMGEDHMLAYITPEEGGILQALGGSGAPGPMGIPSFFDAGEGSGGYGSDDSATGGDDGSDNNNDDGSSYSDDAQATDPGGNYGDDGDDDAQDYSDGSGSQDTGNVDDSTSGDYTGGDGSDNNVDDSDPDSDMDYTDTYTDQDLTDATNIGTGGGDDQDDRPLTNIVNVGAGSNLQYSPQFTADNLEDRGLDPKGFMSPENYAQTTQGQAASQAEMNDAMAIDQAINQAPAANLAANIVSTYNPEQYGLGVPLDDPLGLGVVSDFRDPFTDALIEGTYGARATPRAGTQVAGIGNVPGADVAAITRSSFAPTIGGVEDDLIGAITQGRSDLYSPFTNNPGNLKQAREDLTTETIKGFNADGTPRTGPALFNTLEAGQKALDDQLGRYGDRGISTPTDFVNTYLGTDVRENPLENRQGYINAVQNAVGSNFDLSNPATRDNITQAIARQELGQRGVNALNNQITAATGLDQVFNAPITSAPTVSAPVDEGIVPVGEFDVRSPASGIDIFSDPRGMPPQLSSQIAARDGKLTVGDVIPGLRETVRANADEIAARSMPGTAGDMFAPTDQLAPSIARDTVTDRDADALSNIAERNLDRARDITNRGLTLNVNEITGRPEVAPTVDNLLALGREAQANKQDAQAAAQALGVGTAPEVQGPSRLPDQVFDIDTSFDPITQDDRLSTVSPDVLSSIGREQRIDDVNTFRSTVPDAARIFGGRQVSNLPTGAPVDFEEQVGKPYSGVDIDKIEQFYNAPMTFDRLGVPPGMFSTALNFVESKARDSIAADLISGNFDPIYDSDGKITGSRNPRTGKVQSGMDMNAPVDRGDNNPLILRPIAKAKKDEKDDEKEDKPPNLIGDIDTKDPVSSGSFVVDSPFKSNVGDFKPVGFSSGDLNKLIAAITGVAAPKSMKKGGVAGFANGGRVDQALDNLLATG